MAKKQPSARPSKRPDLGARWSPLEREEIDLLAEAKGVRPTTILRMAVKKYIVDHANEIQLQRDKREAIARGVAQRKS